MDQNVKNTGFLHTRIFNVFARYFGRLTICKTDKIAATGSFCKKRNFFAGIQEGSPFSVNLSHNVGSPVFEFYHFFPCNFLA